VALADTIVVLRPDDAKLAQLFSQAQADVVLCPDARLGMGHSLACGVAARPAASGWIIALADMPNVRPETITAIAMQLYEGAGIVVPVFQGQRGHPVGFHRRYLEALLRLRGDAGARSLLQSHDSDIRRISVEDAGVLQDIDTREDAQRFASMRS